MVFKWLRRMRPSAMGSSRWHVGSAGHSLRFSIIPAWASCGEKASFLNQLALRARAFFVFKNMSILVKICAIIIYIYFPVYHLLCVVGVVILRGFFLLCIAALLCLWVYLCVRYGKRVTLFLNHTIARMFGKEEMKDEV